MDDFFGFFNGFWGFEVVIRVLNGIWGFEWRWRSRGFSFVRR